MDTDHLNGIPEELKCTLNPSEWNYLSEGNQHLILKYNGDIPSFIGTVLRLRKTLDSSAPSSSQPGGILQTYLREEYLKRLILEDVLISDPLISDMTKTVNYSLSFTDQ